MLSQADGSVGAMLYFLYGGLRKKHARCWMNASRYTAPSGTAINRKTVVHEIRGRFFTVTTTSATALVDTATNEVARVTATSRGDTGSVVGSVPVGVVVTAPSSGATAAGTGSLVGTNRLSSLSMWPTDSWRKSPMPTAAICLKPLTTVVPWSRCRSFL